MVDDLTPGLKEKIEEFVERVKTLPPAKAIEKTKEWWKKFSTSEKLLLSLGIGTVTGTLAAPLMGIAAIEVGASGIISPLYTLATLPSMAFGFDALKSFAKDVIHDMLPTIFRLGRKKQTLETEML